MKTITYNPETHVLVPREPSVLMAETGWDDAVEHEAENIDIYDIAAIYRTMIAAAPQPEPVESEPVMEAILCVSANGLETAWRQKESSWWSAVEPIQKIKLYTTPQPDRTDRVRELEEENARLNSEIEMLKSGKRSNIRLGMEIAASQAYAEQLREALQWAKAGFNQAAMGIIIQRELEENFNLCRDALALPRDTSALDSYVSEKRKEAVSTQKEYYESVFQDGAKRIATLTRQRDLAVEALEKQGHSAGCRKNAFGDICTCGLDDLLSTIKEIEAMAKGEQR